MNRRALKGLAGSTAALICVTTTLSLQAAAQTQPEPSPQPTPPSKEIQRPDSRMQERAHDLEQRIVQQNRSSPDGRKFKLGRIEAQKIAALEAALAAKDYGRAATALAAAKAEATSVDAKYVIAALQLQWGQAVNDTQMIETATDEALSTGAAPEPAQRSLYRNQGLLALNGGKLDKAEAAFTRLVELEPNNPDSILLLAETKNRAAKFQEALPLFDRAIAAKKASGEEVPASWSNVRNALSDRLKLQK